MKRIVCIAAAFSILGGPRVCAADADEPSALRHRDASPALEWECGPNAHIEGTRLVVDVPVGEEKTGGLAAAGLDLAAWDDRAAGAEIVARGERISMPFHWYNGLKFQFEYEDADSREMHYQNTPARLGDFPEQTIHLRDFDGTRRRKARLVLGLQESSGHVEFDLSTLRIGEPEPLWPITNQAHRCAYSVSERRKPLRGVMSPHRMTEDDFDTLQSWGATLIRYQMWGYGQKKDAPVDLAAYGRWLEGKLDHFESFVLPQAAARGMKVVLDLHDAPGGRDISNDTRMCHDRECAEFFIETWRRIARRFAPVCAPGVPTPGVIYAYDLVNEPMQTSEALPECDFWSLQRRAAEAIREIDPDTPILVECNGQDSPGGFASLSPLNLTNILYEVHMYIPLAYTHQGVLWKQGDGVPYPNAGKDWNAESLRGALRPVREFQLRHGARIYCGEFSAVAWAPGADQYLRDCISIFEEYGWDWTYHAFREWPGWSVEHEGPDAHHLVPTADTPRKRALVEGLRGR